MGSYLQTVLWCSRRSEANNLHTVGCSQFLEKTKGHHLHSMCSVLVQVSVHCVVFATITGKPHGMRSISKLTSVDWMPFLRLSEAQTCKWAVFATSWNLSSADCTTWHGVCSVLRLTSVNCTVFATFWDQHLQIAWALQLFESTMCTWESARSIQELGLLRFFLPAVLLPSFPPSLFLSLPPVGIMFCFLFLLVFYSNTFFLW